VNRSRNPRRQNTTGEQVQDTGGADAGRVCNPPITEGGQMGCLGSGGRADAIPSSADGEYGSAERVDQQPT